MRNVDWTHFATMMGCLILVAIPVYMAVVFISAKLPALRAAAAALGGGQ